MTQSISDRLVMKISVSFFLKCCWNGAAPIQLLQYQSGLFVSLSSSFRVSDWWKDHYSHGPVGHVTSWLYLLVGPIPPSEALSSAHIIPLAQIVGHVAPYRLGG